MMMSSNLDACCAAPRHHYTAGLLRSVPSYTPAHEEPVAPGQRPRNCQIDSQRGLSYSALRVAYRNDHKAPFLILKTY